MQPLSPSPNYEEHPNKLNRLHSICKQGIFNLKEVHTDKAFQKACDNFSN